jgi:protocatechuate 3,4-dioxygenase beta subunit
MGLLLFLVGSSLALSQTQPADQRKASLEGQIVNSVSGEAVRKARATLRPKENASRDALITVSTDAAGKFVFVNLEPGEYHLSARRDGFANAQYGKPDSITLGQAEHKIGITMKMTPFGVITGRVSDQDGDPIRAMQVSAMTYRYTSKGRQLQENRSATTNDVGEYRIFDIPHGKYFLKTVPRGIQAFRETEEADYYASIYYPGVADAGAANGVEVGPGRESGGIDFVLRRTRYATIRGRIVAPEGAANVSVGLMTTSDSGTSTSTTNVEGKERKFQITGVAPGLVYLVGSFVAGGQRHWAQVPLQIASDDINGIALNPIPPMDLTGQVRIEAGPSTTKPSQVRINLEAPGKSYGAEAGGISDDGRMIFRNIEANTYRVVPGRLSDLYLKSVHWGSTDITEGDLDLNAGLPARTELTVVLGADGGQLEGTVENEKPAAEAVVILVPVSGRRSAVFYKSVSTDSAGQFTMKGIAPGTYKLFAWDKVNNNAVIYDPEFLPEYDSLGKRVEVAANEKKRVELKLIANKHEQ